MVASTRIRLQQAKIVFLLLLIGWPINMYLCFFGIPWNLYKQFQYTVLSIKGSDVEKITHNDSFQYHNAMLGQRRSYDGSKSKPIDLFDNETVNGFFRTPRIVQNSRCDLIFSNDELEINRVKMLTKQIRPLSSYTSMASAKNCSGLIKSSRYILSPLTEEEREFPSAFSILAYKDIEMVEQLLRGIYRPQNYYCIHMDTCNKSSEINKKAMEAIASCFQNVFLASTSVNVTWGEFTVLEPELICMKDLWRYKKWKYFINLTGQEFPLKTNQELVKILKVMKGANLIDGSESRVARWRFSKQKSPVPHNIKLLKGSVHIAVNRNFVDFCLHDNRSLDFLDWLKPTLVPDETFFASLNHNPHLGIPGTFLGDPDGPRRKHVNTITRYKNWFTSDFNCSGKYVREVCVLGVGDLHRLKNDIGLFANKFNAGFQPLALDCLEELIHNRTRDQYLHGAPIDVSFYRDLEQVRLQVKPKNDSE